MAKTATPDLTTSKGLILAVQERLNLPSQNEAKRVLDGVLGLLVENLTENAKNDGYRLAINGLGTFHVKATAARVRRNPLNGESINVPAGFKTVLKLSAPLRAAGK